MQQRLQTNPGEFSFFRTLDHGRSHVLRRSLQWPWLAQIYRNSAHRTLLLFMVSLTVNSFILVRWPFVAFWIAPLLFGIPHLFTSFRYSQPGTHPPRQAIAFVLLTTIAAGVGFACSTTMALSVGLMMSVLWLAYSQNSIRPSVITGLGILLTAIYFIPRETSLVLLIGHNFLAFLLWNRKAKTREQRKTVFFSFALMVVAIGLLILYAPFVPEGITESLFSGQSSPFLNKMVILFLVSQSAHYFIWLKAIPDYASSSATPGGFAFTFVQYQKIFSVPTLVGALIIGALLWLTVFLENLDSARTLYLGIATFHGLFEIMALLSPHSPVLFSRPIRKAYGLL